MYEWMDDEWMGGWSLKLKRGRKGLKKTEICLEKLHHFPSLISGPAVS